MSYLIIESSLRGEATAEERERERERERWMDGHLSRWTKGSMGTLN